MKTTNATTVNSLMYEISALRASLDEAYERVAVAEHRAMRLAAELEVQKRLLPLCAEPAPSSFGAPLVCCNPAVICREHFDAARQRVDEMRQQRDRLRSSVNHHATHGCEQCRVLLDELEEEKRG